MKVILKEEILRLNCPGFGEQSFLNIGKAKSLDAYKAILVNPVSILHLFDYGPEPLNVVDAARAEGLASLTFPSDDLLTTLNDEITVRTEELVKFLENGGLLVYFLCRPFVMQGPSLTLDNYLWLLSLAPAKSTDKNVRQMSAVATGRNVEPCEETASSEFADYFSQSGLEWNTVIRTEFLTEGYTPLATAGVKKCIAGELYAGDNGGRIVFLPAPYSPDFDRSLIECANFWYQKKLGLAPNRKEVQQAVSSLFAPQRTEQKPALLKFATRTQDGVSAVTQQGQTNTGNGINKVASSSLPPGAVKPQLTPNKIATSSLQGAPALTTRPAQSNVPPTAKPPVAGQAPSAQQRQAAPQAPAKPGQPAPLTRGEAGGMSQSDKIATASIDQRLAKPATTVGGAPPKPATPLERKSSLSATNPDLQTLSVPEEKPASPLPPPTSERKVAVQSSTQVDMLKPNPEPGQQPSESPALTKSESLVLELKQALEAKEKETSADRPRPEPPRQPSPPAVQEGLIKKLEVVSTSGTPAWSSAYSISELEELRQQQETLAEQMKRIPLLIQEIEGRTKTLNAMKNALLAGSDELINMSIEALSAVGWQAQRSPTVKEEIWLSTMDKPEALARVVRSSGPPTRADLAQLAESIITFWGDHEVEPKGILIACGWADTPIAQRQEAAFPDALVDFAQKKSICLLTTLQLLCAYTEIEFGRIESEDIRTSIIGTSGALQGLELKAIQTGNS